MGCPLLHDVDDTLWPARAVILDDLGRRRQARGFIRLERRHDILRLGQERRHAARIKDRLTRTVGADRYMGCAASPSSVTRPKDQCGGDHDRTWGIQNSGVARMISTGSTVESWNTPST